MKKDFLTISEAAELEGVSRQRMHQLIHTYGVNTEYLSDRFIVIPVLELKKIPPKEERELNTGVSLGKNRRTVKKRRR